MKILTLCMCMIVLSGCAIFESRLSVQSEDFAVTLAEMEVNIGGIPGTTKVDADACMLLIRNATILGSAQLKELIAGLHMETGDCKFGIQTPTATIRTR